MNIFTVVLIIIIILFALSNPLTALVIAAIVWYYERHGGNLGL